MKLSVVLMTRRKNEMMHDNIPYMFDCWDNPSTK